MGGSTACGDQRDPQPRGVTGVSETLDFLQTLDRVQIGQQLLEWTLTEGVESVAGLVFHVGVECARRLEHPLRVVVG